MLSLLALGLLNIHATISIDVFWFGLSGAGVLVFGALAWGAWKFCPPRLEEAFRRLDRSLPARPLQGLRDYQRLGASDPISKEMWHAHQLRLEGEARKARPVPPDLSLSTRDPYGLRFTALFLFTLGLIFGSVWNLSNLQSSASSRNPAVLDVAQWEGWITPPSYSSLPTLYLNDLTDDPDLSLLKGSRIEVRLYGEVGTYILSETTSARTSELPPASEPLQTFDVVQAGEINIAGPVGARWSVYLSPDYPPNLSWDGRFETDFYGESTFSFSASDDYGVSDGQATISIDLENLDRRYGLSAQPRDAAPILLDLPMPLNGDRLDFTSKMVEDFSRSTWSNLPVKIKLEARDAIDQVGHSEEVSTRLPGRKFFDPLAAALVEQRRDLLWSDENAPRVANILRAISHKREAVFRKETNYLRLRFIITRLEATYHNRLLDKRRDELADALWDLAMSIEDDDGLEDALERMRRAQERLSQAMKNGASPEEIAELMRELKRANEDYMRQLSREAARNQDQNRQQPSEGDAMTLSQNNLQDMMDRIQKLMEEGRMAEAQQALDELQEMMENMQIAQGEGGEGSPGDQATEGLSETLREQQRLSDEAFRQLQDQTGREGQQSGQSGETDRSGQSEGDENASEQGLAERQGDLRGQLGNQRDALSELDGGGGENTQQSLEDAEEAMRRAEEALEEGDFSGALDRQAEAMENLREGLRNLSRSLAQGENAPTEEGGTSASRQRSQQQDPLGRMTGNGASQSNENSDLSAQDMARRAQELLEEIRRRSGERQRPEDERSYLRKLLEKF
ncbi:MAG: DUF4175 domain-containing protein [Rhodobacteraceae bacterium]|nr:DUF4175 domain-containing protein [Paracoccaceae bacterium]